jgi:hypothetical protein
MTKIILVEKGGELNESNVKKFAFDDLYKKCKFRKQEGFERRALWKDIKIKMEDGTSEKWTVAHYARNTGKAGGENKYDLPPPVDQTLFFGTMALVALDEDDNTQAVDLSIDIWHKIYEKLFGGFFDLAATAEEDDEEEDELADLPSEMKTKHGYLKDDFVVDDISSTEHSVAQSSAEEEEVTDQEYESELDFEEYENMDSTDCDEDESSEEEEDLN